MNRFILPALAVTVFGVSPAFAKIVGYQFSGVTTVNRVAVGAITTEFPVGTKWTAAVEWETTSAPLNLISTQARYRLAKITLSLEGTTGTWTTTSAPVNDAAYTINYIFNNTAHEIGFSSGWGPANVTNSVIEDWAPYAIILSLTDLTGTAFPSLTPAPNSLDFNDFSPLEANSYFKMYLSNDGGSYLYGRIDSIGSIYEPEISVKQKGGGEMIDGTSTTNFGTVKPGKPGKVISYAITNQGGTPLKKLAVTTTGKHKADFTVAKLSKSTLAKGESVTVKVTFDPEAKGARKAALKIVSTDSNESPFEIGLSGTGK